MARVGEVFQTVFRTIRKSLVVTDSLADMIDKGQGWNIQYSFTLAGNSTAYLVFETFDSPIHATSRRVKGIDIDNQIVDLRVTTLTNATVNVLGNDISNRVFNANLNKDSSNIDIKVYDETTTITDEGLDSPFSSRIKADRRMAGQQFIANEYVLKNNNYRVLKFENLNNGDIEVEYSSAGYQL